MSGIVASSRPLFSIDGRVFTTNLSNLKTLSGYLNATANTSLWPQDTQTAFQVPTGSTFRMVGIAISKAGTATHEFNIAYADAAIGPNSASVAANPVYMVGTNGVAPFFVGQSAEYQTRYVEWIIPAEKYPFIDGGGSGTLGIVMYGFVET